MEEVGMENDRVPSLAAQLGNPDPDSVRVETWVVGEDVVREVLDRLHPTLDSEETREDVIAYVQNLIRCNLGLEIFPYGSVPLKTYLPDGDLDLTVISTLNLDESLPTEVYRVLQEEEKNGNTEFELRDTQFIDAEVKLVKCIVQDIVIDISFNQLGGLCTLCFLEHVDRLAGKDHLFKRSLILIKAWCYYESRILGAHHGLISTYALEILVLYIFQIFHASLNGPLEVLYRFLDYYAKFDWDNYCISLEGPVCKSSLPSLAVDTLDNQGTDVLLGAEFMKNCMDMFIVPPKGAEADLRTFSLKNLNIIDPLKENNNLGRSVNKGNYFRVRSAFRYGARKLGKILQQPTIYIEDEIRAFFSNTLQRHKPHFRPDSTLIFAANGFDTLSTSPGIESYYDDDMYSRFSNGDLDDYMNDHNALPLTEPVDVKAAIELWMERGGSKLVNGSMVCVHVNEDNSDSSSDNLSDQQDESHHIIGEAERVNLFPDLTGHYDGHIRNLLYGQGCHGYALSNALVWGSLSPPTSPYGDENPWDLAAAAHSWPVNANGASRGTGPYIPIMSYDTCEHTQSPSSGRGRDRGPPFVNGPHFHRARVGSSEPKVVDEANDASHSPPELSPKEAGPNASLYNQTHQQVGQVNLTASVYANQHRKLEFGSFGTLTNNPSNEQRSIESSLHLMDEEEFPPLSA